MAQTKLVRIPRPFTKGWVTDRPRWSLEAQEMADGQDVFWPRGVAVQRRPWSYVQAQNPLGSTNTLGGLMAVQFNPQNNSVTYVVSDAAGQVGIANASTATVAFTAPTPTLYLPRAFYNGEVLLCAQDGRSPIIRWAGWSGGSGTVTATNIQFTRNSKVITGTGTQFNAELGIDTYLLLNNSPGNFGPTFRVDQIESATSLALMTPPWMASAASSPVTLTEDPQGFVFGWMGLRVAVTQMGTATISGTSLTGQSTGWQTNGPGYDSIFPDDIVARLPQPAVGATPAVTSTPDAGYIDSISSNTGATLAYTPAVTYSNSPYVVLRSMPGREVCSHQNRLWITGVEWEPNRVYVTPPSQSGYDLGQANNGIDSFEIDYANSVQAKYVEVPDRFSDGRIVSLLSGRNVLLVLRSNNCYGIFGAWPGITVEQIADGAGCVDVRAATASDDGLYWAGEDGIYRYVPGRGIEDITRDRVNREWRRLMRDRSDDALVSMGVVNRHLVISYLDGLAYGLGSGSQEPVTWVYDTVSQTWCGKASDIRARYMNTARLRGVSDDLFFIEGDPSVRRIGALAASFTDDDSSPSPGDKTPSFYAETGSVLTGAATDSFRPIEMRVGYECEGSGSTLDVKTGNTEASPAALQATLPATSGDISTVKLRASTSSSTSAALGKQGREFGIRMDAEGDPERVAVHEVQIVAREYVARD
jgi:hypothetical protein